LASCAIPNTHSHNAKLQLLLLLLLQTQQQATLPHLLNIIFSLHHRRQQPPSQITQPQAAFMVIPLAALLPRKVATPREQTATYIS
jgi:hypothetical protein